MAQLKLTPTTLEWVQFGVVKFVNAVGKDVLVVGSDMYMLFYNLHSHDEILYRANNPEVGEGVHRLTGHKTFSVFAFAESKITPRIFIKTFPEFRNICILENGTDGMYASLEFSETDYFASIDGVPHFELTVWNWRNGDRIASVNTGLLSESQILRCNKTYPVTIAQIQKYGHELKLWDVMICGKRCVLNKREVVLPSMKVEYTSMCWTSDGGLFVLDSGGNVYTVNNDLVLDMVIKQETVEVRPTYICYHRGGLLIAGPDDAMKKYKKSGNFVLSWTEKSPALIRKIIPLKDHVICVSTEENLYTFNGTDHLFAEIKPHRSKFDSICMIYPLGQVLVTLAHQNKLALWKISTGELLDMMELPGEALFITENKEYPYVGISFAHGLLLLVSVENDHLIEMASFHLTRNPLSKVYFGDLRPIIVVCDMTIGQFFMIEGAPGGKMQIIATCVANYQIVDFIMIASPSCFRVFAIIATDDKHIAGSKFIRFCIIKGRPKIEIKEYQLRKNFRMLYERIYATTADNRDRVFYAMPFDKKDLHEIEVKRGETIATVNKKIHINHLMRKILIHMDEHHILTYAYDGLVIVRSTDWLHQLATVMPIHRRYQGVAKAYVDPLRKYIVALGRDNVLVCLSLTHFKVDATKEEELSEKMSTEQIRLMFEKPTMGFIPSPLMKDKVWLEIEEIKIIERERLVCEKEKKYITVMFKKLRQEVRILLTKNIDGPDNEKLDIQEFNLDVVVKEKRIQNNVDFCERTKIYLENLAVAYNDIASWIKRYCWDQMSDQGKGLWAIFGNFDVQNYVLLPNDGMEDEILAWTEEQRKIEVLMACEDMFEPWLPIKKSELTERLAKVPNIAHNIPIPAICLFLSEEETVEEEQIEIGTKKEIDMETITAFAGSLTHTFITAERIHYSQKQIQTFSQINTQKLLSKKENLKLRRHFNKEFENLMGQKVREINNVVERNARLRHILSEFNYFSENKLDVNVVDPEWKQVEDPELILKVDDKEVGVIPYISPSEQAILDAEAAERERLRLLMLADDFRERALYAMMWGVLEIRWEDELRKEVQLPKCMKDEKDPENYTEEDLKAIRDYEEKVKFLNSERERYKKILTGEYAKLGNTLREGVRKFNGRLSDLLLLKIRIDSAIGQENLKINRLRLNAQKRIQMNINEMEADLAIKHHEKEIDSLIKLIASLQENIHEVRAHADMLQGKEKTLERNFKKEFADANPVALEQIQRLYKKRPKVNIRSITSITLLLELAKCVITHEKTLILTTECLDFLKAIDNLDLFVGVTSAVDEVTYAHMCKHRRLRIESEIKIKAGYLEVQEAENTIALFNKSLSASREVHNKLVSNLLQVRSDRTKNILNIELQIVLKQGFVEVPTTGTIFDFKEALLVSKNDVAEINKIIVKVGNKKLKAMQDTMNFRRGILAMEWEHKRMKMKIYDLNDNLKDIYSVKVTKEIQAYLKMKTRGDVAKELSFEQEIELVKKSYERIINEKKQDVRDLSDKIRTINKETKNLNDKISNINVDVCEFKLDVDQDMEQREKDLIRIRMATLIKRAKLVKLIQENHNEILVLQTELELLRLKTYPTLKFKIVS